MNPLTHFKTKSILCLILLVLLSSPFGRTFAQSAPLDLWSPDTLLTIRDKNTLNYSITARTGYFEVYFDSNNNATWADGVPPYAIHTGGHIRIHGYLASPLAGGPYPAIVIGHGHHGHGSPEEAMLLAAFGICRTLDRRTGAGPLYRTAGHEPGMDFRRRNHECACSLRELPIPLRIRWHAGIDLFEKLSGLPLNPFRIDRTRLGVIGASMGGQFTYYINGVDDRVKGAVGIAVAGDWRHVALYRGRLALSRSLLLHPGRDAKRAGSP